MRFFTFNIFFMNPLDSTAKNMPKDVEVKLSSCGLQEKLCGIPELRLQSNISLKSCGIAITEVLPSSCRIAIADSKKVVRAHLWLKALTSTS
jgi:hypothetical protein